MLWAGEASRAADAVVRAEPQVYWRPGSPLRGRTYSCRSAWLGSTAAAREGVPAPLAHESSLEPLLPLVLNPPGESSLPGWGARA